MPEILTLPPDSFHLDECERCGHWRIAHYDEWEFCQEEDCECEKYVGEAPDIELGNRRIE